MENQEAKKLVESFAKVVSAVAKIDTNGDGKLQLNEIFELVQVLASEIFTVYGDVETGIDQLANADSKDYDLFVKAFAEKFDLANDEAEALIEKVIYLVQDGIELFFEIKGQFKK
jgi:hypothetical protein